MNKDQFQGSAKHIAGRVQEAIGKLLGNKSLQIMGFSRQLGGSAQKCLGNAKTGMKRLRTPR